jgi:hypothetical protein
MILNGYGLGDEAETKSFRELSNFGIDYANPSLGDLGIDYSALWSNIKKSAADYIKKDLPGAIIKTTEDKAVAALQPTVQEVAEKKAGVVVSKGNVALTAGIGLTAGFLIAGGSLERRIVGGVIGGILGALAGFKIGLVSDA